MSRVWKSPNMEILNKRKDRLFISASTSVQKRNIRNDQSDKIDWLSRLPQDLVHDIFAYLGPKCLLRIGMVSRRFRQLFLSCPYLSFYLDTKGNHWRCDELGRFLSKYFDQLDGSNDITSLSLKWCCDDQKCCDKKVSKLGALISRAVELHVQKLWVVLSGQPDLVMYPERKLGELSLSAILNYEALKSVTLDLNNCLLNMPMMLFNSLESLALHSTKISANFSLGDWLSTCCPSLKILNLFHISGVRELCLNASSLEDFTLNNFRNWDDSLVFLSITALKLRSLFIFTRYDRGFGGTGATSTIINAPNLRFFKWLGKAPNDCKVTPFTSLQSAILDFRGTSATVEGGGSTGYWVCKLIKSASTAQYLQIDFFTIQSLFSRGCLPIVFTNVHHLDVTVAVVCDSHIEALVNFLHGFPNLQSLSMIHDVSYDREECRGREEQNHALDELLDSYPAYLSDKLREVEIALAGEKDYRVAGPEIGMVKYFLRHGRALEKMSIFCSSKYYDKLAKIIESFKSASSRAAIFVYYDRIYEKNCYDV